MCQVRSRRTCLGMNLFSNICHTRTVLHANAKREKVKSKKIFVRTHKRLSWPRDAGLLECWNTSLEISDYKTNFSQNRDTKLQWENNKASEQICKSLLCVYTYIYLFKKKVYKHKYNMAKVPIRKPKRATLLTKRSVCLGKKFREKSHKLCKKI